MGLFGGMAAGLYRYTKDGRRVAAPFSLLRMRRVYYLVSDVEVPGLERRQRLYFLVTVLGVLPIVRLLRTHFSALVLTVLFLALLPLRFWLLRGLPRVPLRRTDLKPVDRLAHAQAVGLPTLCALLCAGLLLAGLQLIVLVTDGVWWSWLGLVLFLSATASFAHQIYLLQRAPNSSSGAAA